MPEIYRVDKFTVPEQARLDFWSNVRATHDVLRRQPGFLGDTLLEKHSGDGVFNAVTIVRWSDPSDLPGARHAVGEAHRARGFRPVDFFQRTGISADLANYIEVSG